MSDSTDVLAGREAPLLPGQRDDDWLHQLIGDWQLLSDLSFADLVLWVPEKGAWVGAAQARPTTGTSIIPEDVVGQHPAVRVASVIEKAYFGGSILTVETADHTVVDVVPVRSEHGVQAVMTRHTPPGSARRRGRLESTYLGLAQRLLEMIASATFPDGGSTWSGVGGTPRVGDGVIALDASDRVEYASPNAVSALRRLGVRAEHMGARIPQLLSETEAEPVENSQDAAAVLTGRAPWHCEVRRGGSAVLWRSVPLSADGKRVGAALLLRDVSELRRRERELLTKDATIREIHHRVKNNLQTVAALLRLQARRVGDSEAKQSLADAGRRVAVIAAVHETLSEGFDDAVAFDDVALRGLNSSIEVSRDSEHDVSGRLDGSFGIVSSEDATTLAMILAELIQNAVEHGLRGRGGHVTVAAERSGQHLDVRVIDDGVGWPSQPSAESSTPARTGLGTQIVRTFVSDLHGEITWTSGPDGGTVAAFTATLRPTAAGHQRPGS